MAEILEKQAWPKPGVREQAAERRLMSGFHGLWSVGGFAGAGLF